MLNNVHNPTVIPQVMNEFKRFNIKHHQMPNAIGMWPNECECLIWCLSNAPSGSNWLEIGSFCGGSAVLMGLTRKHIESSNRIFCTDIGFNPAFDQNVFATGRFQDSITKLEMDSSNLRQVKEVQQVGFAFIDGFHSYRQVLNDFYAIQDKLVDGAIVGFHDVSPYMWNETYLKLTRVSVEDFEKDKVDTEKTRPNDEDFQIDQAICKILKENPSYEIVDIPVRKEIKHYKETGLLQWHRGSTSPFNSFFAIQCYKG